MKVCELCLEVRECKQVEGRASWLVSGKALPDVPFCSSVPLSFFSDEPFDVGARYLVRDCNVENTSYVVEGERRYRLRLFLTHDAQIKRLE